MYINKYPESSSDQLYMNIYIYIHPEIFHKRVNNQNPAMINSIYIYIYTLDYRWALDVCTFMENFRIKKIR